MPKCLGTPFSTTCRGIIVAPFRFPFVLMWKEESVVAPNMGNNWKKFFCKKHTHNKNHQRIENTIQLDRCHGHNPLRILEKKQRCDDLLVIPMTTFLWDRPPYGLFAHALVGKTRHQRIYDLLWNLKNLILWKRNTQNTFALPIWWNKSWRLRTNRRWSKIWWRITNGRMQEKSITTVYQIEIQTFMLHKTATWNDMKISEIEDRVWRQIFIKNQRPSETCSTCGSKRQNITERVENQTKHWINTRFIMYVLEFTNYHWRTLKKSTSWKLCRITRPQEKTTDYLYSAKKHNANSKTNNTKCACTNKRYTQSDMEEFGRKQL